MDMVFLKELSGSAEVFDLKQELLEVSDLERENARRLDALGFASELCTAVSSAAGADGMSLRSDSELLTIAAEGSNVALFGIASGGPQAPRRLAEIIDEMIAVSARI